jgi:hypothetical protein
MADDQISSARDWLVVWQDRLFQAYQRARYFDSGKDPHARKVCWETAEAWREVCGMIDAKVGEVQ